MMDELDIRLINLLQNGFPVSAAPFAELGEALGIDEHETLERTKRLRSDGYIRRIGGIFDSSKLGYVSILCAAVVPENQIETVAGKINTISGVTHNYIRNHRFNMWFTLTSASEVAQTETIKAIRNIPGIDEMMVLPSESRYKIRAVFDVSGGSAND